MSLDAPIIITLDRPRALRWTMASLVRLGRMDNPPEFADLLHRSAARSNFALCAFLWACVEGREDFADPEALAEHLDSEEKVAVALHGLVAALRAAGVLKGEKKTALPPEESPANAGSNGPTPSSSSAPRARPMKTSRPSSTATS